MEQTAAAKFKELMDNVAEEGLVTTKHGRAVAQLIPIRAASADLIGALKGRLKIQDALSTGVPWNAES